MKRCEACGKECSTGEGCTFHQLQFGDQIVERLRYVGQEPCKGCGVVDGGVHHFLCPAEVCPRCEQKLATCSCMGEL